MLGMPWTNSTLPWLAAVTVYGLGKTFYWPTMLGVVSERFPKSGALGLGICGGVGMISAGLLGGPGIGYKQDFAAVRELRGLGEETYQRYRAPNEQAPLPGLPKIAGLDNGKVGVLDNYQALQGKPESRLQIEKELDLLRQQNRPTDELARRLEWWQSEGQPNEARLRGGKQALAWTAAVPAIMALGYLLMILYFRATGGYKAEVLVGHAAQDEKFTGGVPGPMEA
jgi:hypothetical protein